MPPVDREIASDLGSSVRLGASVAAMGLAGAVCVFAVGELVLADRTLLDSVTMGFEFAAPVIVCRRVVNFSTAIVGDVAAVTGCFRMLARVVSVLANSITFDSAGTGFAG